MKYTLAIIVLCVIIGVVGCGYYLWSHDMLFDSQLQSARTSEGSFDPSHKVTRDELYEAVSSAMNALDTVRKNDAANDHNYAAARITLNVWLASAQSLTQAQVDAMIDPVALRKMQATVLDCDTLVSMLSDGRFTHDEFESWMQIIVKRGVAAEQGTMMP
jgi:hypothetical protein